MQPTTGIKPRNSAAVEVCSIDPLSGPDWDRMVNSHPGSTIFHTSAWARILVRTYQHRPFYFAVYQSGRLMALVPLMEVRSLITGRRGVSVPFADFSGPLLFDCEATGPVYNALSAFAAKRGWKHWEVRGGGWPDAPATISASFYSHSLDLRGGSERVFASFEPAVRRAVRKAERSGLSVTVSADDEAVSRYYNLHARTRRRHGLPPQPRTFFAGICDEILKKGMGFVILASQAGRPLAGAVFFTLGNKALYKFGACDERFMELRANNLVMWNAIQLLSCKGLETLDFGRTSPGQSGLRHYKRGWGAVESTVNYFRSGLHAAPAPADTCRHTTFFSRMPLGVNRLLGSLIYPHLD